MPTVRLLPSLVRAGLVASAVAGSAGALSAQQRALYAWNGRVDREVLLVMRGGNVDTRAGLGVGTDRGNFRVGADLPRTDGAVDVRVSRGRGAVDVVQQPSARNDYTAVVRVRDDADGAGDYQITTYWRPSNGSYGDNGGYANDGGHGDNGGYGGYGRDDVTEIRIRGRRASTSTVSGRGTSDVRTSVSGGGLPDRGATVRVRTFDGRGSVRVAEQPSARNGYTAVLRVEDRQGGAGYYDLEASWY